MPDDDDDFMMEEDYEFDNEDSESEGNIPLENSSKD